MTTSTGTRQRRSQAPPHHHQDHTTVFGTQKNLDQCPHHIRLNPTDSVGLISSVDWIRLVFRDPVDLSVITNTRMDVAPVDISGDGEDKGRSCHLVLPWATSCRKNAICC